MSEQPIEICKAMTECGTECVRPLDHRGDHMSQYGQSWASPASAVVPEDLRALIAKWQEAIAQLHTEQVKAEPGYAVCLGHRIDVYTRCLYQLESALAARAPQREGGQ